MHIGNGILAAGLAAGLALGASTAEGAEIIAQWDFNDENNQFEPSTGSGEIEAVETSWGSASSGSPNDPGTPNYRNRLTGWDNEAENKSQGWQVSVDTSEMLDIVVWWDTVYSSQSLSRFWTAQYSVDGENFIDIELIERGLGTNSSSTWITHVYDLSEFEGVSDNPNFAFRVMNTQNPETGEYEDFNGNLMDSSGSQLRLDLVTVQGEVIPEPGSMALLGAGGMLMLLRRRSASTK